MLPNDEQRLKLQTGFAQMRTKEDLLAVLNDAKTILFGEQAQKIPLKALTYYCDPRRDAKRYREFQLRKKSGGIRTIHSPNRGLKYILRCLNLVLQCVFTPELPAYGFVPERNIVQNAQQHLGKKHVYNIDLKDFFPSIELHRIKACLKLPPFGLGGESEPLAFMIAGLCTANMTVTRQDEDGEWKQVQRFVLPQGAPTSPTITNIICQKLDRRLRGLAKAHQAVYTRYADDITFSSDTVHFGKGSRFVAELQRIIAGQSFHINPKKTRLQKLGCRQEVTGLTVNEKANVTRRYVKEVRMYLYYWEKYSLERATKLYQKDVPSSVRQNRRGGGKFPLENVLAGKLDFLRMVKGNEDPTYLKLRDRYVKLTVGDELEAAEQSITLELVLKTFVQKGLTEAMSLYAKTI